MRRFIVIALLTGSVACDSANRRAGFVDTFIRQDSGKVSVTFDTIVIDRQVQQLGTYALTRKVRTVYFAAERPDRFETFRYVAAMGQDGKSLVIQDGQRKLFIDKRTGHLFSGRNEYSRLP